MKRILSIDGGGIRGLIPAVVCQKMEEWSQRRIHEMFDLIAGTSTGGIIALALAAPPKGKTGSEMFEFYRRDGVKIFSRPRGRLRCARRPKYDNIELRRGATEKFGDIEVKDAISEILVTMYDIKHRTPFSISRRTAKENKSDNYLMRDVAMATSAAPTYFSPIQLGNRVLVDGGIVANNPALLAVAEARKLWPDDEVLLVSLGTGTLARPIPYDRARNWGMIGWAPALIDCIFDGTAKAVDEFLHFTMNNRLYWRFQYGLSDITEAMDRVSEDSIAGLQQIGEQIVWDNERELKELLKLLTELEEQTITPDQIRNLANRLSSKKFRDLNLKNWVFQSGIQQKLEELLDDVTSWENGAFNVSADDAGDFLVKIYQKAKISVFSTSLKKFFGTFRGSPLPGEILSANQRAEVPSTRVFVFDHQDDVSGFDINEMARHHKAGIEVRIQIGSSLSTDPIEDFTIIDESAVGVTEFVGPRNAAARWTFFENDHKYLSIRDSLISQSMTYAEFSGENEGRFRLWNNHDIVDVSEGNIESYQRLSSQFFKGDAAEDWRVLAVQQHAGGGIYVLQRNTETESTPVGILALFPVSRQGFRRLEADEIQGSQLVQDDIESVISPNVIAYYFGAIAGVDRVAKAALVDLLKTSIRELSLRCVESVFARPVTNDGLRLLKKMDFKGPGGQQEPVMNHVCRLRLGS